ncbi:phosphate ABC transporter permease subunit PstC [Dactylococcopsis salina]|uniref:Phosphate transport system permease protein n=1 Tax=Dactylococcopsis salina (strain PCC 8305) TaxID=13035 RepID=K9YUW8_DACS8|nr:phosphate ABC transporter permease subunit PstC [Dactylococcopsis salina]AFZ49918.1 phosphate ABC transporter, permease protein PstC [Dactylococcopsis salina PCC 8305]
MTKLTSHSPQERTIEASFRGISFLATLTVIVLMLGLVWTLTEDATEAIQKYGLGFLLNTEWNPVSGRETYGILPMLYGTIASSSIALLLAIPLGVTTAIFLSEKFLPSPLENLLVFLIELLAAIPSVVYGFWGIFVLIPFLQPPSLWLNEHWGEFPLFSTPPLGPGLLPAGVILAIMILPIITAISRSSLKTVPSELREAVMALGVTRWEAITFIVLPTASSGIIGAVILALGRALGETMAVTMVIGNANQLQLSLFAPASTIASLLANQFAEAQGMQVSALMYAGLVLLIVTLAVNLVAEIMLQNLGTKE